MLSVQEIEEKVEQFRHSSQLVRGETQKHQYRSALGSKQPGGSKLFSYNDHYLLFGLACTCFRCQGILGPSSTTCNEVCLVTNVLLTRIHPYTAVADPGGVPGVPRNPLNFVHVKLETIRMCMYMYQLFIFDYTCTGTPL